MTTSISPAAGAGALFTQQGIGSTPGYAALDDRRSNSGSLQEGVYGTSTLITAGGVASTPNADFMVTQRGAGANQSVDINMPSGGFAFVQGDTISGQGLYCVPVHTATINEAIAAADATNPRIDQIILEIQDNVLDASGGNQARTRVVTGSPQPGATLSNRTGAAALPGSALLLADVLVPNGSSTVPNSNIRDRRKWARGALSAFTRSAGDYTTAATSPTLVDSTNLQPRIECAGDPLRLTMRTLHSISAVPNVLTYQAFLDGTKATGTRSVTARIESSASSPTQLETSWTWTPAAGSHLLGPAWGVNSGTGTLAANATSVLEFTIEELVRQNGQNSNGVTTG